ncbi:MAG: polysaccharide deacetylase family protein [Puniceicoccales bacterium]
MKPWLLALTIGTKLLALYLILCTPLVIAGWVLFFAAGGFVVLHLIHPRLQGICDVQATFQTSGKEVWLTIDDGPSEEDTPQILDLLDQFDAKATFFMIGERAGRHPDLVSQVLSRNQEVGAHTFSHPLATFWMAGPKRSRNEVERCVKTLRSLGANPRRFRSPVGIKSLWLRRILRENQLQCVAWSIRSGDTFARSVDEVVRRVLRKLRPGAILLLHEGTSLAPPIRIHALRAILIALQQQGYRCILPPTAFSESCHEVSPSPGNESAPRGALLSAKASRQPSSTQSPVRAER